MLKAAVLAALLKVANRRFIFEARDDGARGA
jgi:hypothetical protein